eukprot:CAMPEP_0168367734 /NCGR_PEP_ID=MMETSP0228-20121227/5890_1 /TAXON_ID=133427 /ORGANISM="Protoceratium reticulatum, Strain CCCM 535 (=CCMP 1889)" /LENGTH=316 /DNA_ID=CAMNT_0008380563 /DNA_START=1 /DNA_END=952 /DNA_ORIENTATION=+
MDDRNAKLLQTLSEATDMLTKADEIQVEYTEQIRGAREKASKAVAEYRASTEAAIDARDAAGKCARARDAGGMFDFGLTLPFVAVTFLLMMAVLNALWYGPVTTEMDDRNAKLLQTLSEATDMLTRADEIQVEYTEQIRGAREKASKAVAEYRASTEAAIDVQIRSAAAERDMKASEVRAKLEADVQAKMEAAEAEIARRQAAFVKETLAGVAKLLQTLSEATDMLTKADEIQVEYTAQIREAREKASKAVGEYRATTEAAIDAQIRGAAAERDMKAAEVKAKLEADVQAKMEAAEAEIEKRKAAFVKETLAGVAL